MPELPEVETVVRTLRPALVGARVVGAETSGLPLHLRRPVDEAALRRELVGARVRGIERRGKYIVVAAERGRATPGLLVHLGMTGRLRVQPVSEPRVAHTHVVLALAGKRELRFVDPRRFGWVRALPATDAAIDELAGLGPDPLRELDAPGLAKQLAASRAPLKAFLLDQRRVSGLGNIYVCEVLHRLGLHPAAPARSARRKADALVREIRAVLEAAIANRGTTFRSYVDGDGRPGENQLALGVYGREGQPCPTCGALVRRRVDAGRSTFFCGKCQRR